MSVCVCVLCVCECVCVVCVCVMCVWVCVCVMCVSVCVCYVCVSVCCVCVCVMCVWVCVCVCVCVCCVCVCAPWTFSHVSDMLPNVAKYFSHLRKQDLYPVGRYCCSSQYISMVLSAKESHCAYTYIHVCTWYIYVFKEFSVVGMLTGSPFRTICVQPTANQINQGTNVCCAHPLRWSELCL